MLNVNTNWFLEKPVLEAKPTTVVCSVAETNGKTNLSHNDQLYFQTDAYEEMYSMLWELHFRPENLK